MYYTGKDMVKNLKYGSTEVKAVYYQGQRIYPNIVDQQTGYDYTDWNYDNLPERTRTAIPWTQDVYSDGSLGEKVKGTPEPQKETATRHFVYGTWEYTINTAAANRTRTVTERFQFSDIAKDVPKNPETEAGARSQGGWTYDWVNSKRNATITYTFSDDTKTATLSENGTVSYNFTITPANTNVIPASGGSKSVNASGNIAKKWNNAVVVNTTTTVKSLKITSSSYNIFSISGLNINAGSRGSILGNEWQTSVCGVAEVDNRTIESTAIIVKQAANTGAFTGMFYFDRSDIRIPRQGGMTTNRMEYNFQCKYSSGATQNLTTEDCFLNCNLDVTPGASWLSVFGSYQSGIMVSASSSNSDRSTNVNVTISGASNLLTGRASNSFRVSQY